MTTKTEVGPVPMSHLKHAMRDTEELLQNSAEAISEKGPAMRERLTRTLESAKATYHRIEEKAKERAQATDKAIRDHPYQTLGLAFGVGLLIGVLVARK